VDRQRPVSVITRRGFMTLIGGAALGRFRAPVWPDATMKRPQSVRNEPSMVVDGIRLFLAGDVMLGRGIDQVLQYPGDPRLHEPYVTSAERYVELAESANGPIPRPVDCSYVWGDALGELRKARPDARIINLETSITRSARYVSKGINYKMSPENAPCLAAAAIDCCVLANNHVLDWGREGLLETLEALGAAGIHAAGAGRNAAQASAPAVLDERRKGRVVIFAFGSETSGISSDWAAGTNEPGVNLLPDLSDRAVARIAAQVRSTKRPGDVLVASIHWGANWGYEIPSSHRNFAHGLIDEAGFDVVHGHSSHHPKGIEIHKQKLILYGCGDFLNDYEGIGGHDEFRGDLTLMYLALFSSADGSLLQLNMIPFQIRRFRLCRASREEARWLCGTLDRETVPLGAHVTLSEDSVLTVQWG
jgi:poly-gamma-glutamate capsule biosynthesis protein CapA/YwtB (metallophosphatase superfamily)